MTATFGSGTDTYVYEPEVEQLFAQLRDTLDEAKQEPIYRQIGDVSFNKHLEIPLFWISPRIAVNPKVVSDYLYPGSITGTYTHVANIKAATK